MKDEHSRDAHIIGTGRCGSTLLSSLLNRTPNFSFAPRDAQDFVYCVARLVEPPRPWIPNQPVFHNYHACRKGSQLARLEEVLEWNSMAIQLVRDPRSVIASWRAFARKRRLDGFTKLILETSIETWCEFWIKMYSPQPGYPIRPISYEQLVWSPSVAVRQACLHFDIRLSPMDSRLLVTNAGPDMARWFRNQGTSLTPEGSIDRWRKDLTPDEIIEVCEITGDLMQVHGYTV